MAGEQFSLCWDNFHKNMSTGMHSLLESGDLVDVTLAVEGKYLKAHKMVLSVCSPYFRELFQNNPCKHPIMFMKDVSYIAMSDLLTFMYQGEVQVNQEHLATFIKTAEALQIKGLTGDGNGDIADVAEDIQNEKPPSKRAIEVETEVFKPTHRPKKSSSSSLKRQRLNASSVEASVPKVESLPATPSTEQIIQFKMEPYETGDQSHIENLEDSQGDNYGEETVDDSHIEDPEDYSMLEGEEEPQVGTSGDGMGDSQDGYTISYGENIGETRRSFPKLRKYHRIVHNGFLYNISTTRHGNRRYYRCANKRNSGCFATAFIETNGCLEDLSILRPHNHPPDRMMEMKYNFEMELTKAVKNSNISIKAIYDSLAEIHPDAAKLLPFDTNLSNKLKRRRSSPHEMYPYS